MTQEQFNAETVLDVMRAVVEEVGRDYVYPDERRQMPPGAVSSEMCRYVWYDDEPTQLSVADMHDGQITTCNGGTAGCIVARVVCRLIPDAQFREFSGVDDQPWIDQFDLDAQEILNHAQNVQDRVEPGTNTWGQALDVALAGGSKEHFA